MAKRKENSLNNLKSNTYNNCEIAKKEFKNLGLASDKEVSSPRMRANYLNARVDIFQK